MCRRSVERAVRLLVPCLTLITTPVPGANRLRFVEDPLLAGGLRQQVAVAADHDVAILGFSLGVNYQENLLSAVGVALEGTVSEGAEFLDVGIDAPQGLLGVGVIFSLAGATSVPAGTSHIIARLEFDVLTVLDTSTDLHLENVLLNGTSLVENVLTDDRGLSVLPEVASSTIAIESRVPRIASVTGNQGFAGTEFTVTGSFFAEPDLAVTVCGVAAAAVVDPDGATARVTAPVCPAFGFAPLEICSARGCASTAQGFLYQELPVPVISGFARNEGRPGDRFAVLGENFALATLTVGVCGSSAEAVLEPDASLQVTAPPCAALGFAPVEVCNAAGCATVPEGFFYTSVEPPPQFLRGDGNGDSRADLSDGIFILSFLFRGGVSGGCADAMDGNDDGRVDIGDPVFLFNFFFRGGQAMPAPYPLPGTDPTADALPDC